VLDLQRGCPESGVNRRSPGRCFVDPALARLAEEQRSNVLAMQWSELNLDDAVWRIPITKNDPPQNVILSPEAAAILKARKEIANKEPPLYFRE
jgi:integrase